MKSSDCCDWLLENGGPIIRYLTARERISSRISADGQLRDRLMQSSVVRYWMGCLNGRTRFNDIHGSRDTCFENALGKLTLFGIRQGAGDFDQRCKPYLRLLEDRKNGLNVIQAFYRTIIASLLAMAGYLINASVRDWVEERLGTVFTFVRRGEYSIYVDKAKFKGVPAAFRNYPLINPDLYMNGQFALPWIYDMFAFRVLLKHTQDRAVASKIGKVISYIIDSRYQLFPDGYGIVVSGKNRYNVMGWNVWLPGYNGMHADDSKMGCLVQRLELVSEFPNVLSSRWFASNLNRLEEHTTSSGTYRFPKQYIKEKKNSYFVTGAHMGLGENRRQKLGYEIESSFWMLKIRRAAALKEAEEKG